MQERNFNDPRWKAVRFATYKRDEFKCGLCSCSGRPMEAHHIIPYSRAPHLEFVLNNLITLCKPCHELVTGQESNYEEQFKNIVALRKIANRRNESGKTVGNHGGRRFKKPKWKPRNTNLRF